MGDLCVSLLEVCRLAEDGVEIEDMLEGGYDNKHQSLLLHEYLQQQQQQQQQEATVTATTSALLQLPPPVPLPAHPKKPSSASTSSSNHNHPLNLHEECSTQPSASCSSRLLQGGPCFSCQCTEAPQWRRPDPGTMLLCNRCGIHYMRYKKLPGPKKEQQQQQQQQQHSTVARYSAPSSPMHCGKRKASDAWAMDHHLGGAGGSHHAQAVHFSVGSYPGPSSTTTHEPQRQPLAPNARARSLPRQGSGSYAAAHPSLHPCDGPPAAQMPKLATAAAADAATLQGVPAPARAQARRMQGSVSSVGSMGSGGGCPAGAAVSSVFSSGPASTAQAGAGGTGAGAGAPPSDVFTAAAAVGKAGAGAGGGQFGDMWHALLGSGGLGAGSCGGGGGGIFDASQFGTLPGMSGLSLPLHSLPPHLPALSLANPLASTSLPPFLGPSAPAPYPTPGVSCIPPFPAGSGIPSITTLPPPASHALSAAMQPPPHMHHVAAKKAAAAPPVSAMFAAAAAAATHAGGSTGAAAQSMRTHMSLLNGMGGGCGGGTAPKGLQPPTALQAGSGPHAVGPSTTGSCSSRAAEGPSLLSALPAAASSATVLPAAPGSTQQQQQQDALAHTLRLLMESCPASAAAAAPPLTIPPLTNHQPAPSLLALQGLLPPALNAPVPPPLSLTSASSSVLTTPPLSLASTPPAAPAAHRPTAVLASALALLEQPHTAEAEAALGPAPKRAALAEPGPAAGGGGGGPMSCGLAMAEPHVAAAAHGI